MVRCSEIMQGLGEEYPLCCENSRELFDEVCHHVLVMQNAADKLEVPLDELIEFFYKGKIKLEMIQEQEEVLKEYGR